jgi:hypothetical protein
MNISATSFTSNGTINPGTIGGAGTLTFIGNLVQGSTSSVTIDASGTTIAGTDYDQIVITSGSITLAGNATVVPFGGYTPTTSDVLTVVAGSTSTPVGSWTVSGWTQSVNLNDEVVLTAN